MRTFDFSKHPRIANHIRHLAAFGTLKPEAIKELVEGVGELVEQLERAEAFIDEMAINSLGIRGK